MNILLLLACHFIGDFGFQSKWMAENKGKNWEINFYHAATYTAVFIILAKISLAATIILIGSHFLIEPLSCRWKVIKYIWVDQILHLLIIAAVIFFKI